MKIVVQNFKTGVLSVADVPAPRAGAGQVLVRAHSSLISSGTDRAIIGLGKKGYLGKALDRPDLARKVINRARTEGLWPTYKVVKNLIAEPIPLGYSLVGTAVEVGRDVGDISVGDRVACAGLGYANHAELVAVPQNLCVRVPNTVSDEQASYVTLGAIALHGLRQADQQIGATVLVVGLGLVGQLTLQLCVAAGLRVVGLDLDPRKLDMARAAGATVAMVPSDSGLAARIADVTGGFGVDAVLLTVGSRDSGAVFEDVAKLCRDRARVVVVGDVKMDIARRTYFEKELEILQSRSYGPGRYDPAYEAKGQDYPIGYVRWTERRNLSSFVELIGDGRLDPARLTTHRFPIAEAAEAYDLVTGKKQDFSVGIVLEYPTEAAPSASLVVSPSRQRISGQIGLGVIGAGTFAKGILLPALMDTKAFDMVGVATGKGISAKSVAERYGARIAHNDGAALLDDPSIQAVVIATRHDSHARYVIEALNRGKHVFVEKPLAISRHELSEVEAAARASSATLTVGFNRRFSRLVQAMATHFAGRSEPMAMLYRINAGRIPLKSELSWVHDPASGGGRIIGEACHFIDTMQSVSGSLPVAVQVAHVNPRRSDVAGDDIVTFTVTFADGSIGTVHYWSNGDASYPKERFEAFAQERMAILDNFRTLDLVAANRTERRRTLSVDKGFAAEASAFVAACRTGNPAIPLEGLLATTEVTLAVSEAIRGVGSPQDGSGSDDA
ncbi:bi-domain-containing oxidoreductase [Bradyrhizobium sp.]|uniref:bi-domain-containing oxidoreductase n=1 Tax=Bradyrhizobium sp. TaxID=376 RepID=UPI001D6D4841|nr:bi-domain-containing oxidoreductase [Bradyrhizobium sp.]MBI5320785.1 bi-domain-containing oxidoreductase [Bradyrhizobium sp.]